MSLLQKVEIGAKDLHISVPAVTFLKKYRNKVETALAMQFLPTVNKKNTA